MNKMIITRELATKVRDVVAVGLTSGLGVAEPGKMCVEAAACYALGLPHGDDPGCVNQALRRLKIHLNDARWSSNQARAAGLRRLAVAQLGSLGTINTEDFVRRIATMTIRTVVPAALRAAARPDSIHGAALEAVAVQCEQEGTSESAQSAQSAMRTATNAANAATIPATNAAAYAAAYAAVAANAANASYVSYAVTATYAAVSYAADATASVKVLSDFAEAVVQILIDMHAPGCEFLDLVPLEMGS